MSKTIVLEITEAGDPPGHCWQINSTELPPKKDTGMY